VLKVVVFGGLDASRFLRIEIVGAVAVSVFGSLKKAGLLGSLKSLFDAALMDSAALAERAAVGEMAFALEAAVGLPEALQLSEALLEESLCGLPVGPVGPGVVLP
jgi:hypothetical protein